jgi:superoxide reductase
MPHIFTYNKFKKSSLRVRAYADKHAPVVLCPSTATRDLPFSVTVRIGTNEKHPNTVEHHFCYVQLWDLETLVGEARFDHRALGNTPLQIETHFTIIPRRSLRLTAWAYCNQHGLWESEEVFVHAPE